MINQEQSGSKARTGKDPSNHPLPFVEIIGRGKPSYMIRVHLTPFGWWKWRRAYLHVLGRPDADREHHDHPWSFWTLVLWGGYTEKAHVLNGRGRPTGEIKRDILSIGSVRYRPATHAHLITRLHTKRVVTLVLRDNVKVRDWGFWSYEGANAADSGYWRWIPWREYHAEV